MDSMTLYGLVRDARAKKHPGRLGADRSAFARTMRARVSRLPLILSAKADALDPEIGALETEVGRIIHTVRYAHMRHPLDRVDLIPRQQYVAPVDERIAHHYLPARID